MDKLQNAVNVFGLANGQYGLSDIKQAYRRLASANHPDKGGNTETMQLINTAFEELCKFFASNGTLDINQDETQAHGVDFEFIQILKTMTGVVIEVCGYWVWLSGDTYLYKDKIKELGFKFSGSKKSWYWSPTIDTATFRRGSKSMKKIRIQYGSKIIDTEATRAIN
jgi:hypothetical protein